LGAGSTRGEQSDQTCGGTKQDVFAHVQRNPSYWPKRGLGDEHFVDPGRKRNNKVHAGRLFCCAALRRAASKLKSPEKCMTTKSW
jgi:hypothetical protein